MTHEGAYNISLSQAREAYVVGADKYIEDLKNANLSDAIDRVAWDTYLLGNTTPPYDPKNVPMFIKIAFLHRSVMSDRKLYGKYWTAKIAELNQNAAGGAGAANPNAGADRPADPFSPDCTLGETAIAFSRIISDIAKPKDGILKSLYLYVKQINCIGSAAVHWAEYVNNNEPGRLAEGTQAAIQALLDREWDEQIEEAVAQANTMLADAGDGVNWGHGLGDAEDNAAAGNDEEADDEDESGRESDDAEDEDQDEDDVEEDAVMGDGESSDSDSDGESDGTQEEDDDDSSEGDSSDDEASSGQHIHIYSTDDDADESGDSDPMDVDVTPTPAPAPAPAPPAPAPPAPAAAPVAAAPQQPMAVEGVHWEVRNDGRWYCLLHANHNGCVHKSSLMRHLRDPPHNMQTPR
jgi:hypothetical protein